MSRNKPSHLFRGSWKIVEMEQWDLDFINLEGPGFIRFNAGNQGELQFGAVRAELDWRAATSTTVQRIEFSLSGHDEGDPVSGRGWAEIREDVLNGHLYFHLGDDSWFKAEKPR